jgi:hypothetical protein
VTFEPLSYLTSSFHFTAQGVNYVREKWQLTGECNPAESNSEKFFITWQSKQTDYPDEYFEGVFDTASKSIVGSCSPEEHATTFSNGAYLSQQPPEVLVCRPHPGLLADDPELGTNRYRSLWRFALDAVLLQVRRKMWSWSYFRYRRNNRKRYLELKIRSDCYGKPLADEEIMELFAVQKTLLPADARCLLSQAVKASTNIIHMYVSY